MIIGIDVSSLQGPHRMRGIGYTAANFLKNIPRTSDDTFTLYMEYTDDKNSLESIVTLLKLPVDKYKIVFFSHTPEARKLPGKLRYVSKIVNKVNALLVYKFGDKKYPDIDKLDAFIQLDQSQPLPKVNKHTKTYFIAYDLIPYVMESDYLWGYKTSRRHNYSRRGSIKASLNRYIYLKKIKLNIRRSSKVLAISHATKDDLVTFADAQSDKVEVITLGVTHKAISDSTKLQSTINIDRYHPTS